MRSREWTLRPLCSWGLPLFLTLALLTACGRATSDVGQGILGRWQRISPVGPGDPSELSAEYLEFRQDGALLVLLKDMDTFWWINSATYTVTSSAEMQVTGSCWQGWERYACTGTYTLRLSGDELRLSADNEAEYHRIGGLSRELPPTLAPPLPSPTP
jgi:hypothetical protein